MTTRARTRPGTVARRGLIIRSPVRVRGSPMRCARVLQAVVERSTTGDLQRLVTVRSSRKRRKDKVSRGWPRLNTFQLKLFHAAGSRGLIKHGLESDHGSHSPGDPGPDQARATG